MPGVEKEDMCNFWNFCQRPGERFTKKVMSNFTHYFRKNLLN